MPAVRPLSLEEQIAHLQAEVRQHKKELSKKDKEIEDARKQSQRPSQKLIPRPKGQGGRTKNGYSLKLEMGLADDRVRYQRLSIQKELKFFQRFQGGWPIRELIKQYLRNAKDKHRRDLKQERAAEADDSDDWTQPSRSKSRNSKKAAEEDEEDEENVEEDVWVTEEYGGEDTHMTDAATGGDDGEDETDIFQGSSTEFRLEEASFSDLDEEPVLPAHRRKDTNKLNEKQENCSLNSEDDTDNDTPKLTWRRLANRSTATVIMSPLSTGSKRKSAPDNDNDTDLSPLAKKPKRGDPPLSPLLPPTSPIKTKMTAKSQSTAPAKKTKSNSASLPSVCPAPYCKDGLPDGPTTTLILLFHDKQHLLETKGKNAPGSRTLTLKICAMIKEENLRRDCLDLAYAEGWPLKIDFSEIAERVRSLADDIIDVASDSNTLLKSPVWLGFLPKIGYKVHAFSCAPAGVAFCQEAELAKRCGYFGPKGKDIITKIINSVLEKSVHEDQIYQTVAPLIDTPQRWDLPNDNEELISPEKFVDYILAPHVAVSLISEDFEVSFHRAFDILKASCDFGDLFNDIPPPIRHADIEPAPAVKSKLVENADLTNQQPAKASQPGPIHTTMGNFPPPVIKKMKSVAPQVPTAGKKRTTSQPASSHSYATRASKRKVEQTFLFQSSRS
ncbi:hypothetical protein C8R43DRAFT_957070 [Mycena crocata]|nr:hypothetical protein C8R43DRAFT_957070 [Mycena crocata]